MSAARVLIAPDSFKGSCAAAGVARALAEGWRAVRPDDDLTLLPLADGGEGTLEAIEAAVPDARRMEAPDAETFGLPGSAYWLLLPDGTGVVELAITNGLGQLSAPMAMRADTTGFGQVIAAALDFGVDRLLLTLGGSASSDGGVGALRALGARFLERDGQEIGRGAQGLARLHDVDLGGLRSRPPGGVVVLTDVTSPLLGPEGAAAVYGPQKGASPAEVALIERCFQGLARALPHGDPREPGAGAAGGTGFGLAAWGAELRAGAREIDQLCGLDRRIASSDVVLTGEGRFDSQSFAGKLVGYVRDRALSYGVPLMVVAGQVAGPTHGFVESADLSELAGSADAAIRFPERWLTAAGGLLAGRFAES